MRSYLWTSSAVSKIEISKAPYTDHQFFYVFKGFSSEKLAAQGGSPQ